MRLRYPENDEKLIEACVNKDAAAWQIFTKKYSPLIAISAENRLKKYSITLPHQDIEDIRQNVLGAIWELGMLRGVKNRGDIVWWLAIVSGNIAIDHIRKNRLPGVSKTISISSRIGERELEELIPSSAAGPSEESANNEIFGRVSAAIASLSPKERLVAKLNLLHGKKYEEIADMLKMPKYTVSSHIRRSKDKLRKKLKDFRDE